jgi:integrase
MSVSPRGNSYEVYVKSGGQRFRVTVRTYEQGEAVEKEIRACLAAGRPVDMETIKAISETGKKTLKQAIERTAATTWYGNKSVETAKLNATLCARVLGEDRALDSIDAEDVFELVCALRDQGNSDPTINRKMSALRVVFNDAMEAGWITKAPKLPHSKESLGRIRYLMDGEEEKLLDKTRWLGRDDMADLWMFLIDTGARAGEALKLSWNDVAPNRVTFWDTKNGTSRSVPPTDRVREMLARRRNQLSPFTMTYPEARHVWDRVKALLGLANDEQWVIHMLRHTCASRLIQDLKEPGSLLIIQKWMGHKSITMTMRYSHLATDALDAAVAVLNVRTTAPVAELADAPALGAGAERRAGSTPVGRTTPNLKVVA